MGGKLRLDGEHAGPGPRDRPSSQGPGPGGFTLLELMMVVSVLAVAFLALSQSLVGSMQLNRVNRESALALSGIREMVEILEGTGEFASVFSRFNADPADDPPSGPSPGNFFAVAGLEPAGGDPDGFVGEIVFPTLTTAAGLELREDVVDPDLGMPRDLNGDGLEDALDHSGDYRLLPVLLRLRWQGSSVERSAEIRTILADR